MYYIAVLVKQHFQWHKFFKLIGLYIIVKPQLPHAGISGDLQQLAYKFPTPEDNFMLQIAYCLRWGFVGNFFELIN